jgi:uncharacterized membrane protein
VQAGTGTAVTEANDSVPAWLLSASYALHMLATVLWVGGLTFQSFFLLPLLTRESIDDSVLHNKLVRLQTRFQPIAWLSLAVLLGTGLTQMAAHPQYEGLLALRNRWSVAIFAKHLAILPMLGITAFQSFFLHPGLQRELLKKKNQDTQPHETVGLSAEQRLVLVNVVLSVLVLTLTAIARTS